MAFFQAVKRNNFDDANNLLNTDWRNDSENILIWCVKNRRIDWINFLVQHNAIVTDNTLLEAVKIDLEIVKLIEPHIINKEQAFIKAAAHGKNDIVTHFLAKKIPIDCDNGMPLILACEYGHVDTVKLLINKGADIHVRNDKPLRCSARNGNRQIVEFLLQHNANADIIMYEKGIPGTIHSLCIDYMNPDNFRKTEHFFPYMNLCNSSKKIKMETLFIVIILLAALLLKIANQIDYDVATLIWSPPIEGPFCSNEIPHLMTALDSFQFDQGDMYFKSESNIHYGV
jgi:ankyrin repeat protein